MTEKKLSHSNTGYNKAFTIEHVIAAQIYRDPPKTDPRCQEWFKRAVEEARERIDTKETM